MIKSLLLTLTLLLLFPLFAHSQISSPTELKLAVQQPPIHIADFLSEDDQQWIKNKKSLRIGIYSQNGTLAVQSVFSGQYRGINADYLSIIQRTLGIEIKIINYDDKQQAIDALSNDRLDAVLTELEYKPEINQSFISSIAVTHSWPNLLASISNVMSPLKNAGSVRVSTVGNYPDSQFIYESFPNAEIITYENYEEALHALSLGEDNYFIGDSLTTSNWLSQEFKNQIIPLKYWNSQKKESFFLFRKQQTRLLHIINDVLKNINSKEQSQIAHSFIDEGDLSFLINPIIFSPIEEQWIKQHKKIKAIINPWYIPFTLVGSDQEIRGITGDLLNFINLQTGLTFEPVIVHSYSEMIAETKKGGAYITVPAIYNKNSLNNFSYTQPFLNTQFVCVSRKDSPAGTKLTPGVTVVITSEHPLLPELLKRYPEVKWQQVKNVSIALNMVACKKADIAIANRLAARYFNEHYYPHQLTWQTVPDSIPAAFTFAIPQTEPELKSILDKARDNIPQREIYQIVSKWLRSPDIKIETWELYNKPFYCVVILATIVVVSTLIWTVCLAIKVRNKKRAQRLLIKEKNKAQQASKENREFLSRMSHEIRTPVSAIIGYLELLQHSSAQFKSEDSISIDQAAKASRSLLKLIGEILDLEKIESGVIDVVPKWGKIDSLITAKIALFHAVASKKGVDICYTPTLTNHQVMLLDFQLLGQVLNNIIGNAVKFTQQGSINISVSLKDNILKICVADTGPGISQDIQSRLFDTFIQGGHQSDEPGSGLGLTISKMLMTKMNGTILLTSEVNKGTTLTITLPVESAEEAIQDTPPAADLSVTVDKNLRVLIADDRAASRLLLKRQLALLGIKPDEAADGQEVLNLLQQAPYDILITDINMPIMDGITLAKTIREQDNHLTICALTATAQAYQRERCLEAGMNECLFEPVNISQIALLLSQITPEVHTEFDLKRLTLLAQGNRKLMLSALKDAQQENYNDLANAHLALARSDYETMQYHVHRMSGTALLLGASALACQTQKLEEKLFAPVSDDELLAMLEQIDLLLAGLDIAVDNFKP